MKENDPTYTEHIGLMIDSDTEKTMTMLAAIEEEYSCSGGICPGSDTSHF